MKNPFKLIYKAIQSSILCIRFPFLYPRNRFTGLHYNNWKVKEYCSKLAEKYKYNGKQDPGAKKVYNLKISKYNTLGTYYTYWTNWWAEILYNTITWYHNVFLQILHCIPTYTELDAMPSGWRKAFGIQMCKEIKHALLKAGGKKALYKYRITQIKEKYGELCWYDGFSYVDVQKIIQKYEYISARTCIECGNVATGYTPIEYWKSPYCDNCKPKDSKYFIDFGLRVKVNDKEYTSDTWYGYTGDINYRDNDLGKVKNNYKEYIENSEK